MPVVPSKTAASIPFGPPAIAAVGEPTRKLENAFWDWSTHAAIFAPEVVIAPAIEPSSHSCTFVALGGVHAVAGAAGRRFWNCRPMLPASAEPAPSAATRIANATTSAAAMRLTASPPRAR